MKISFRLPAQVRIFITPMIVLVVVALSGRILVWPWLTSVGSLRAKAKENEMKVSILTTKLSALSGANELTLDQDLRVVNITMPEGKDLVGGLVGLRIAAADSGVLLESLRVSPGEVVDEASKSAKVVEGEKENQISYSIVIQGSKDQIQAFFERVRAVAPLMELERLSYAEKNGLAEATVAVTSFYVPGVVQLGSIDSPIQELSAEEDQLLRRLRNLSRAGLFNTTEEGESSGNIGGAVGKENPFTQ